MVSELTNIRDGFRMQRRVISALMLREAATRHGKTKIGYLWALLLPLGLISMKVSIFTFLGMNPHLGDSLALFFASGFIPYFFWQNIVKQTQEALIANQALFTYPQVLPLDVIIARMVLESATLVFISTVIFSLIWFFEEQFYIKSFPSMVLLIFLLVLFASGFGLINAAIIRYIPSYASFFTTLSMPLYFTSGIFFIAERLPLQVREWLVWNPILQYSEWMRSLIYMGFESSYYSVGYLFITALSVFFVGISLMKITANGGD